MKAMPSKATKKVRRSRAVVINEEHSSEKLLKAALVVFGREGFKGATTKEISRVAGVNEALIIRHFENKEGLFWAVIEKNITNAKEEITFSPKESVEEELLAFSDHLIDIIHNNRDFYRILYTTNLQDKKFKEIILSRISNRGKAMQERIAVAAKREGLKDFDYKMVEGIVLKQAYMSATFASIFGFSTVENAKAGSHEAIKFFWRGIRPNYVKKTKKK